MVFAYETKGRVLGNKAFSVTIFISVHLYLGMHKIWEFYFL